MLFECFLYLLTKPTFIYPRDNRLHFSEWLTTDQDWLYQS